MEEPTLLAVLVGQPRTLGCADASDPFDRPWTTAFHKTPVPGAVFAGASGLEGDSQADRQNHGGADKAVLAYSTDHYPLWMEEFAGWEISPGAFGPGAFGENLAIARLAENGVCIGDIWRIGGVLLEISQPRQPCWKLGRRWRNKRLPKLVVQTGRTGWYLRVVQQGEIQAGLRLELDQRRNPQWTVQRANNALHTRPQQTAERAELAALPELSESWKRELAEGE